MLLLLFRSRQIDVRSHLGFLREREFRGLSSIFGAARKYGSCWIGQVILIRWKCSATLTVKLNYAPNKNTSFFLLQYYLTHSWEDKGVHIFPKGICPEVNVIARLEFELAYYDSVVHRFNHYITMFAPPSSSADPCCTMALHRHLYHHSSKGPMKVALILKCQSDPQVTLPWEKSDDLTKHCLGSLIQMFMGKYTSLESLRREKLSMN